MLAEIHLCAFALVLQKYNNCVRIYSHAHPLTSFVSMPQDVWVSYVSEMACKYTILDAIIYSACPSQTTRLVQRPHSMLRLCCFALCLLWVQPSRCTRKIQMYVRKMHLNRLKALTAAAVDCLFPTYVSISLCHTLFLSIEWVFWHWTTPAGHESNFATRFLFVFVARNSPATFTPIRQTRRAYWNKAPQRYLCVASDMCANTYFDVWSSRRTVYLFKAK